ncbi:HetP family heterocyst commitment protein [Lyngbya sp. CCY1209]|jgi:hypothetical protein|uniref:HetP family heterocyst commitment protein n=1 Tax=Lyngbya sp. CCY1209 TaxID=2886103 RepID=UPI002D20812E|nr:HetP family heterocyst commitment protein [Lyngbya sp. CCY1209]MEB3884894.1 HetP family heterocyst commitment protein [Lyngbya sp. CCY1209]
MTFNSNRSSNLNKTMTEAQFNEVIDAILAGKYSWACVLILSFAGYNPLHYIPYRTYNRLLKANRNCGGQKSDRDKSTKIKDLGYCENVGRKEARVAGGKGASGAGNWLHSIW